MVREARCRLLSKMSKPPLPMKEVTRHNQKLKLKTTCRLTASCKMAWKLTKTSGTDNDQNASFVLQKTRLLELDNNSKSPRNNGVEDDTDHVNEDETRYFMEYLFICISFPGKSPQGLHIYMWGCVPFIVAVVANYGF